MRKLAQRKLRKFRLFFELPAAVGFFEISTSFAAHPADGRRRRRQRQRRRQQRSMCCSVAAASTCLLFGSSRFAIRLVAFRLESAALGCCGSFQDTHALRLSQLRVFSLSLCPCECVRLSTRMCACVCSFSAIKKMLHCRHGLLCVLRATLETYQFSMPAPRQLPLPLPR